MQNHSFTLIELIIVVIIIGILATIALPNFGPMKEQTFDKEAQVNLRLILAGERIWRMENDTNQYVACSNTSVVNSNLKLSIPTGNPNWNYSVTTYVSGSDFCAQARRNAASTRYWRIKAPNLTIQDPPIENISCP